MLRETLSRAREENERINAFTQLPLAGELPRSPPRGRLRGLIVAIKDNIDVAGYYTTCALRYFSSVRQRRDAAVVATLRREGAIILGKTNMHALALGATSTSSDYGPVRNPRDTSRIAGGSSGGSAAAVALGLAQASLGTDTGGSVRVPAALCGVVGFKPTISSMSLRGVAPLSPSLDHVGILAPDVATAHRLCAYLMRLDQMARPQEPSRLRLGLPKGGFLEGLEGAIEEAFLGAVEALERRGVKFAQVKLPSLARINRLRAVVLLREASWLYQPLVNQEGLLPADVRQTLLRAKGITKKKYLRALISRHAAVARAELGLSRVHALIMPTVPIAAPKMDQVLGRELRWRGPLLRNTAYFNYTGQPAISLPVNMNEGLYLGLQLVGRLGRDGELLAIADTIERLLAQGPRVKTA